MLKLVLKSWDKIKGSILGIILGVIEVYEWIFDDDDELEKCWENETVDNEKVYICDYINQRTHDHTYVRVFCPTSGNCYCDCVDKHVGRNRSLSLECSYYEN